MNDDLCIFSWSQWSPRILKDVGKRSGITRIISQLLKYSLIRKSQVGIDLNCQNNSETLQLMWRVPSRWDIHPKLWSWVLWLLMGKRCLYSSISLDIYLVFSFLFICLGGYWYLLQGFEVLLSITPGHYIWNQYSTHSHIAKKLCNANFADFWSMGIWLSLIQDLNQLDYTIWGILEHATKTSHLPPQHQYCQGCYQVVVGQDN